MQTVYVYLADLVMLVHLAFIVFVLLGALLIVRWPKVIFLHLPSVVWAMWIQFQGGYCPLTPLENWFRQEGGQDGYDSGFVEHYVGSLIYPGDISLTMHIYLGVFVLVLNMVIYLLVIRKIRLARRS